MDITVKARNACACTCCFVTGKNLSPAVASFFKIMIGDDFSRVLFLPPKFARSMSTLVGQETSLEDSRGQIWKVVVSNINGSLVFERGWSTFALDHDLEVGCLVLFFRTRELHFVVKIYDRTSCEKLEFPKRRNKKKRKMDSSSSKEDDGPDRITSKNLNNKNCPSASIRSTLDVEKVDAWHEVNGVMKVPIISENIASRDGLSEKSQAISKAEYFEEMEYMINHDSDEKKGEDRRCNIDLSVFEVLGVADKRVTQVDSSHRSQNDACVFDNNEAAIEKASGVALSDAYNPDKCESVSDKDSSILSRPRHLSTTSVVNPDGDGGNVCTMSNRVIKECLIGKNQASLSQKCGLDNDNQQSVRKEVNGISGASSVPNSTGTKTCQSGKIMKGIKEEAMEIRSYPCNQEAAQNLLGESSKVTKSVLPQSASRSVQEHHGVHTVVKTEIVDPVEGSSTTTNPNNFSLLTTSNQSYVELPDRLPFPATKGRANVERKTVILRDPAERLWPVLYHDKPSLQFLAAGWEALSKANCIKSGDQCLFTIEDKSEGVYSVSVVQR